MSDDTERSVASAGSVGEVLAKGIADIIRIAAEPDWIPVVERLPPDRTVVLAWSGKRVAFGYISDGNWIDTLYGWVIPNGPTHWMPFPAPPTDGK
jgi:hypothetical protein